MRLKGGREQIILKNIYLKLKKKGPPSAADKEEAERLKTEGNNLMRTEKFTDALLMYSKVELCTVLYCVIVEQRSLQTLFLCTQR